MKRILTAAAVLLLAGCSTMAPRPEANVVKLAAHADSGVFIAATLASLGSFEWDSSPISNHAATAIHEAAVACKERPATCVSGQKIVDESVQANTFALRANALCAQDPKTGKCTGDEAQARHLLDQARTALSDVP